MDKTYADTVRLLLAVAPDVFANDIFAMKGGTAINLFVRDMPRLSVDIDVVYLPWQTPRDEALQAINQELAAIATRVAPLGVQTRLVRAKNLGDTKLIVANALFSVALYAALIPAYSWRGAFAASLVTEVSLSASGWVALHWCERDRRARESQAPLAGVEGA